MSNGAPFSSPEMKKNDSIKSMNKGFGVKRVKLKETTLNHSKMVRRIEQKCENMFINVNIGVIIQMNLKEKIELKNQIDKVWSFREKNDPDKQHLRKQKLKQRKLRLCLSESNRDPYLDFDHISSSLEPKSSEK